MLFHGAMNLDIIRETKLDDLQNSSSTNLLNDGLDRGRNQEWKEVFFPYAKLYGKYIKSYCIAFIIRN